MSFLFFLMYAAAAGGLLRLLESTPGAAQEFKIKVDSLYPSTEIHIVDLNAFFSPTTRTPPIDLFSPFNTQ